MFIYNIIQKS